MKRKTVLTLLGAAALIALTFAVGCPFRLLTDALCPVCGTTRAWLSALRLDFAAAFEFNALFLLVPPAIALFLLRDLPRLKRWRAAIDAALIVIAVSLSVYNLMRQI